MTAAQIAADLHAAIGEALQLFEQVDETQTTRRRQADGWCAREVLGHLIDSACNNHRRFVIGQSPSTTRFDSYDQNEWVSRQHYDKVPWRDLVMLWSAYNRHLAHVIACAPEAVTARTVTSADGAGEVTVGFVMADYVAHLRHHVEQIRTLLAA